MPRTPSTAASSSRWRSARRDHRLRNSDARLATSRAFLLSGALEQAGSGELELGCGPRHHTHIRPDRPLLGLLPFGRQRRIEQALVHQVLDSAHISMAVMALKA